MPIQGNCLEILPYSIPANMKVIGMDADSSDGCSVLLSTFHKEALDGKDAIFIDFKQTRIDQIGADGKLKYSLDVSSSFMNTEEIPLIFESNSSGNYFVGIENTLMYFSTNENEVEQDTVDGYFETLVCDNNKAYAVYWDYSSEKTILSSIEDGKLSSMAELKTFDEDYRSVSIYSDSLYLYSRDGVYRFRDNKQECIYKNDDINEMRPFIYGEDVSSDGEICILLKIEDKYRVRHIKVA
jgi:hypothetical protein